MKTNHIKQQECPFHIQPRSNKDPRIKKNKSDWKLYLSCRNSENNGMVAKCQLILSPLPRGSKAPIQDIMRSAPFNPKLPPTSPYNSVTTVV